MDTMMNTEMSKRELVKYVLESMGYHPQDDKDGDISFRYQMKELYIITDDNDSENYVIVQFPQFSTVEDERLCLLACNQVTRDVKLVKVYIDHTGESISATSEFFYTDEGCLRQCLEQSLRLIGVVRTAYENAKREIAQQLQEGK